MHLGLFKNISAFQEKKLILCQSGSCMKKTSNQFVRWIYPVRVKIRDVCTSNWLTSFLTSKIWKFTIRFLTVRFLPNISLNLSPSLSVSYSDSLSASQRIKIVSKYSLKSKDQTNRTLPLLRRQTQSLCSPSRFCWESFWQQQSCSLVSLISSLFLEFLPRSQKVFLFLRSSPPL